MAYKQPSSGLPFKQLGSSPVKQKHPSTIDFWNQPAENRVSMEEPKAKTTTPKKGIDHVGRTVDKLHSTEKSIGKSKEALSKSIKKVKGCLYVMVICVSHT